MCVLIFFKTTDKLWDHLLAILFLGKTQSSIILFSMKNLKLRYVCLSVGGMDLQLFALFDLNFDNESTISFAKN